MEITVKIKWSRQEKFALLAAVFAVVCIIVIMSVAYPAKAFTPTPIWQPTTTACHYMLKEPCGK